jgi:peptidyl-prolyl cis-trans isomerase C
MAMNVSRLPFRPALLLLGLVSFGAVEGPVFGQSAGNTPPSPVAPGDLSKPVFDTKTPVYDPASGPDKAASTLVAEVEGRPITMGDVGDLIRALPTAVSRLPFESLYPSVLEQLIKQQALVIRAHQQGLDDDPEVRREMKAAAERQLTEEYMRREISKGITEAALLARYDRDIADRPGPEEVRVRVILSDTEKAAMEAIAELAGGADFAAVARRTSKDTTASGGGDLGFNPRDRMTAEVAAVAFALPVGQVAPRPVRSAAGWFVVKLEERRIQPTPTYASVRERLRQEFLREGIDPTAEAAEKGLLIRRYNLTGGEVGGARTGPQ